MNIQYWQMTDFIFTNPDFIIFNFFFSLLHHQHSITAISRCPTSLYPARLHDIQIFHLITPLSNSLFRSHDFSQTCTSQLHPVIFHGLLTGFMINFCCVMTPRYFVISCSRYNSPRGGLAGIQFHGGIRVLGQFGNGRW